jgi:hypothetical protein
MVVAFRFSEGEDGGVNVAVARQLPAQPLYLPTLPDRQRPAAPPVQLFAGDRSKSLRGKGLDALVSTYFASAC